MTSEEFSDFRDGTARLAVVDASHLEDKSDRTLLVGYTKEWSGVHVYLKDEQIHCHSWYHGAKPPTDDSFPNGFPTGLVAARCAKVYPEKCDGEFLKVLRERDPISFSHVEFTRYDKSVPEEKFYARMSYEHELGLEPAAPAMA